MATNNSDFGPQRKVVIKAAWWSALQSWGSRIVSLLVFVVLARMLVPHDFGLAAMAMIFITLIKVLIEQGMGESIVQRSELTSRDLNTAFWITFILGCVLSLVIYMCSEYLALIMKEPELKNVLRALSPICLISSLASVPVAIMRRGFNFRILAIRSMAATLISGLIAVYCASAGMGVWSLVVQNMIFSILNSLFVWIGCSWRPGFVFCWQSVVSVGSYSAHSFGAVLSNFLSLRMIEFLIGYYLGAVSLGYFSVGYKFVSVLNEMLNRISSQVVMSTFSRLQKNHERLRNALYEAVGLISVLAFPGFVALSLLAAEIVPLFIGVKWLSAVSVMKVLSLLGLVYSFGNLMYPLLASQGRPDLRLMILVLRIILSLGMFFFLMNDGLTAISFGFAIVPALVLPLAFYYSNRLVGLDVRVYILRCVPAMFGVVAMIIVAFLADNISNAYSLSLLAEFLAKGTAVVCAYLLVVLVVDRNISKRLVSIIKVISERN